MTSRERSLCPPCQRGDCDECMAADHPGMPDLYACAAGHKQCPRSSGPVGLGDDYGIPGGDAG